MELGNTMPTNNIIQNTQKLSTANGTNQSLFLTRRIIEAPGTAFVCESGGIIDKNGNCKDIII